MITYLVGEHYYTTSKFKNGLFTIDHSAFLTPEEVNNLERSGVYQAPAHLNANPSDQEIEVDFPVNFALYKLPAPSNKFVYLHSKYTGRANHTPDRFGNFFSHSIILKSGEPELPAISVVEEVGFKTKFPIDEDKDYHPALTERVISVDETALFSNFTYLSKFLTNGNIAVFAKVLDLIVDGSLATRGNNITINGAKERVQLLILAVNFFLPQHIANKISFATYVNNPKNYPFQLTGIVPECGIKVLDPKYYTLIDANKPLDYIAKHIYTKRLLHIINENSYQSYEQWAALNSALKHDFAVTEASIALNLPALYSDFVSNPQSRTVPELKTLIASKLPLTKLIELRGILSRDYPQLYIDFIIDEFNAKLSRTAMFTDKKTAFGNCYIEHFETNESFRIKYLPDFVRHFQGVASEGEKSELSLFALTFADGRDVELESWLDGLLADADPYFATFNESKIETVRKLHEKYNLDNRQSIPNIIKVKTFDEIRSAASHSHFLEKMPQHATFFGSLSKEQKIEILLRAFNNDMDLSKGKFKNISGHIALIREYMRDYQPEFWFAFLVNNPRYGQHSTFKNPSLNYLQKDFVARVFLTQPTDAQSFTNLFNKLSINDDYAIRWIEEEVKENADNFIDLCFVS